MSRTCVSPDFANWTQSSAFQFVRDAQRHLLGAGRSREGEQTHEGIRVWNRGNALVGISGMRHGAPQWKDLTIDLSFVVSNDGIRFRESTRENIFLKHGGVGIAALPRDCFADLVGDKTTEGPGDYQMEK